MEGRARFTIDTSVKTMNWPMQTNARISPGLRPAPDADRAVVASEAAIDYSSEGAGSGHRTRPAPDGAGGNRWDSRREGLGGRSGSVAAMTTGDRRM